MPKEISKKNNITGEQLLSEMLSLFIEFSNYEELVSSIVTKIGKYFNADRCFFIEHDRTSTRNLPINKYAEYCSTSDIVSHTTRPTNDDSADFVKKSVVKAISVVENINKIDLPLSTKKMLVDDLSVKSYVIMPVYYKKVVYGSLVLHYVKNYKKFTKKEIKLIKAIANNFAIVIGQNGLHSKLQEQISIEKTILSNLPFSIWIKDNQNRYLAANTHFTEYFNISNIDIVGKKAHDVLSKEIADTYTELDLEVIKTKKTKKIEYSINNKYGISWYDVTIAPFYDEKNEITGIIGFAINVTEKKEMRQMEDEFVSTVSHELRTPLTSIKGVLGLLLNGKLNDKEKEKELLNIATENSSRLTTLINDLLDLNKIEAGKMKFVYQKHDVIDLVTLSIYINKQFCEKYNVNLKLTTKVKKAQIYVDKDRLLQVLTNLYSNAIKFSYPKSEVEVTVEKIDKNIRISVTNYGEEISKNLKNKIFDKFVQGNSFSNRKNGGTGLGLNISKTIMKKMNGSIDFVSENNKTTFWIELFEVTK